MSKQYQLVVFDWEGTISDTLGLVFHVVACEAEALGFGPVDPHLARKYVDLGLERALRKLFPHLTLSEYECLLQAVQRGMVLRPIEVFLIPGALNVIQQLHQAQVHLAIATNKGHHSLMHALQATGLDALFKITRSAGQVPAKPYPQMLEEIMDEFGCAPSETLMIGDSPTDIEMAKGAGVDAIGVDYYYQNTALLKAAGALDVFDSYQLVADFLQLPRT
jgi:phosphoglycolate phosphatase